MKRLVGYHASPIVDRVGIRLLNVYLPNNDVLNRGISLGRADKLDRLDHVHPLDDVAEDDVLPIQPGGHHGADEKLGPVRVPPTVGHRQTSDAVLQLEVLILELRAIDGVSSTAISTLEVPALDHELRDDTMELRPLVGETLCPTSNGDKVLYGLWNDLSEEAKGDVP